MHACEGEAVCKLTNVKVRVGRQGPHARKAKTPLLVFGRKKKPSGKNIQSPFSFWKPLLAMIFTEPSPRRVRRRSSDPQHWNILRL